MTATDRPQQAPPPPPGGERPHAAPPAARPAAPPVGARPPNRQRTVYSPVALNVVEWGEPDAPCVALAHGGADFARTFDVFAPYLADAGWRVVAWDQRGHGDSGRAELYGWPAELADAAAVLQSCGQGPVPVVGHSKGGVLAVELAVARPGLIERLAVIDGFTRRQHRAEPAPEAAEHWLDNRRTLRRFKPGTLQELAARRQATNARLPLAWLEYLVTVGADRHQDGRWTWKLDPAAFPSPPHPGTAEVSLEVLAAVGCPLLALQAEVNEPIAGQPDAAVVAAAVARAPAGRHVVVAGVGHFAHIEGPAAVAAEVLAFLGEPRAAAAR